MKNKISTFVKSFWKAIFLVGFLFAGQQVSAETVLKVIPHADLKNIDPIWTTAYITRNHGYMVYDTLFAMDANLKPQPQNAHASPKTHFIFDLFFLLISELLKELSLFFIY